MSFKNIFLQMFYFVLPLLILKLYGGSIVNLYLTMENYMQNWYFNNLIYIILNSLINVIDIIDHHFARYVLITFFLIAYLLILRSSFTLLQKLYLISFFYMFLSHTVHQWYITLLVLFLPVCFSYSALYWSWIIGLTNITVYFFLKNKIWEDFMPVIIIEYLIIAVLIFLDIKKFMLNPKVSKTL
ncbi:MAG: hypothetical protein IPL53_07165 [Ignavibacteria bacterium]|nr:hypothetical protein [Ignavibacteria bacterium]